MASRNNRARAVRAAVLLVLAGLLVVSAIVLCENGVHIPTNLRAPAPESLAQDLSAATGAHWQQAEIPAEDGTVLRAWLFRPAHPNNGRAVILLHGIADTRKGVLAQAAILVRHDYLVLAPDLRGHGVSGGSYITYGVKEAFDVHSWANWLFQTQQITALYGLGESLGGAVLLQSVLREPRFRAIVAEDSFSTFPAVAYYRVARACHIPEGLAKAVFGPTMDGAFIYARLKYGVNLRNASPAEAVEHTRIPILLIVGGRDVNIPPRQSRELQAINPAAIQLWEVPEATHTAAISARPQEFEHRVVEWFAAH